jgi:mannan endo-1,4-beta-mannosidase
VFWSQITPGYATQTSPGVWNEEVLLGMDFVLDQARKRGLKIIWALADNWYPVGGVMQYVEWSESASRHQVSLFESLYGCTGNWTDGVFYSQDFFTDEAAIKIFEKTFETLANRVNTFNGVTYKDDATIFAWNLANEARCQGCDADVMQAWIERVCARFKSLDNNHLVGIGYEGFYHESSGRRKFRTNPGRGGSRWAANEGQDFERNAATRCIDYVGIHVWPDNW